MDDALSPDFRILFVKDGLGVGGTETQLLLLARGLRDLGYKVDVANLGDVATLVPRFVASGIQVHSLRRRHRFDLTPILSLGLLIRARRPDVVQSCHWLPNLFCAIALAAFIGRRPPLVAAMRNEWYRGSKGNRRALVDRRIARSFDAMVANSSVLLREAESRGVFFRRSLSIVNGVVIPPNAAGRAPDGEFHVTMLGRLTPQKRPHDVVLAARIVCEAIPEARFWFVGDGPERHSLERAVSNFGLSDRITFFGERPDPGEFLTRSDCLVLASDHEGVPNVVLEAMACGLPVVATPVGGVPDVVVDNENGILVPPGDPSALATAIIRLIADPSLRIQLGHRARCSARAEFGTDRMIEKYLELYRVLLAEKRS